MKRSSRRTTLLLFLAFALAATFRAAPRLASPELRAEDATVFYLEARDLGLAALVSEHNGYHHLLPRILAALGSVLPCAAAPAFYAWSAFAVFLGLGFLLLQRGMPLRGQILALLALPLMPHDGTVIAHLTDLGSIAALALLPLALRRPEGNKRELLLDLGLFGLAALSGPQVAFFLPIFVVLAVARRRPRDLAILGLALLAAWLQTRHLPSTRVPGEALGQAKDFFEVLGARSLASMGHFGDLGGSLPFAVAGKLTILAHLGFLALALSWRAFRALAFLAGSELMLAATLWAYRTEPRLLLENPLDRYGFVHLALFIWGLAELFGTRGPRRILFDALLLLVLARGVSVMLQAPATLSFPGWSLSCDHLESDLPAAIPVEPAWLIDHEVDERPADWLEQISTRVFGQAGMSTVGGGSVRLSQIGETPAVLVSDESAIVLPRGPADGVLLASLLPRSGRPSLDEEVELVVEELGPDGERRRIASLVIKPLRDHARLLPWNCRDLDRIPGRRLVLRCESRGPSRWWQLWAGQTP